MVKNITAYTFQKKAYESQGDYAHGDYIILNKTFIPSLKLEYHFYNNLLVMYEQSKSNYIQSLTENNIDESLFLPKHNMGSADNDKIFMLRQINLDIEYIEKLKKYYEMDKERKILFDEIKALEYH